MASLVVGNVRLLAKNAGFRNSLERLRCACNVLAIQPRYEQRQVHHVARTAFVVSQVKCNRGYCFKTKPTMKNIQDRILKVDLKDTCIKQVRHYSHKPPLTLDNIGQRIIFVLKLYDKIDVSKLTLESHFMDDLGLDSLDHVEIIMAIEDEFGFEIPDMDAERLLRPADIVRYIADKEDVYD